MPGGPDERSNGEWKANRDFAFKNLECAKGERLPGAWQRRDMVDYLRKTYGDECILFVPHPDRRSRSAAPPAKAKPRPRSSASG